MQGANLLDFTQDYTDMVNRLSLATEIYGKHYGDLNAEQKEYIEGLVEVQSLTDKLSNVNQRSGSDLDNLVSSYQNLIDIWDSEFTESLTNLGATESDIWELRKDTALTATAETLDIIGSMYSNWSNMQDAFDKKEMSSIKDSYSKKKALAKGNKSLMLALEKQEQSELDKVHNEGVNRKLNMAYADIASCILRAYAENPFWMATGIASLIAITGHQQVDALKAQKRYFGGLVQGGTGMRDDVPLMASGGEYVLNKRAVQRIGINNLDNMNSNQMAGSLATSNVQSEPQQNVFNVNITGNVMTEDFTTEQIIPILEERLNVRDDFA